MCEIKGKCIEKEVTGYKIVGVKEDGSYYSIFTGVDYKNGGVIKKLSRYKTFDTKFNVSLNVKNEMNGKTGVFKYKKEAVNLLKYLKDNYAFWGNKTKVIKVKLQGDLYHGNFSWDIIMMYFPVYLGTTMSWEE